MEWEWEWGAFPNHQFFRPIYLSIMVHDDDLEI